MAHIRNLAFGGGGAAGALAYPATVKTLRKHLGGSFKKIKRIAGTSVGAMTALMLAANYSDEEIDKFLSTFNLKSMADGGWTGIFGQFSRLKNGGATYKGQAVKDVIQSILFTVNLDPEITFGELRKKFGKDLYISVTVLTEDGSATPKKETMYFSFENAADTPVWLIVKASAAAYPYFPLVYLKEVAPGRYEEATKDTDHTLTCADGGFTVNLPLERFDRAYYMQENGSEYKHDPNKSVECVNDQTLAIGIGDGKPAKNPTKKPLMGFNPLKFVFAFLGDNQEDLLTKDKHSERSIIIPRCGIPLQGFDTKNGPKIEAAAVAAVEQHFAGPASTQVAKPQEVESKKWSQLRAEFVSTDDQEAVLFDQPQNHFEHLDFHPGDEKAAVVSPQAHEVKIAARIPASLLAPAKFTPLDKQDLDSSLLPKEIFTPALQIEIKPAQPDAKELPPEESKRHRSSIVAVGENKFSLPSAKAHVAVAAGASALTVTGVIIGTLSVIGTLAALASNPVGWGCVFAAAAVCLAAAVTFSVKAYNRRKKNALLSQHAGSAPGILHHQNHALKNEGLDRANRHCMMEEGILIKSAPANSQAKPRLDRVECEFVNPARNQKPIYLNRIKGYRGLFFERDIGNQRTERYYLGSKEFEQQLHEPGKAVTVARRGRTGS